MYFEAKNADIDRTALWDSEVSNSLPYVLGDNNLSLNSSKRQVKS